MATAVFFHAHPDDEAPTGGTMLLASRAGPDGAFEPAFGTEWFIRRGQPAAYPPAADLFAVLESRPDPAPAS